MRSVAIVGAGQSGGQLALGLLHSGYRVTLVSDRGADEVRHGPVMSSQCMFDAALQTERDLDLNTWEASAPRIEAIDYHLRAGDEEVAWRGGLEAYAQSVDQRLKCAAWIERFVAAGGEFQRSSADVAFLEALAASHDLVVVSTGKGDLGRLFPRDDARSPFTSPQRVLALTYVRGMSADPDGNAVRFNVVPGVGEYFVFPALTLAGPCDIMVFEGVPGGPMDCWSEVATPEEHLTTSLEILRAHFPREYARCADVALTDPAGVLVGAITPTVRKAVGVLPSGRRVLGMGDAVILNDPVTGQGSNTAAKFASYYLESIVDRGDDAFDERWMGATFENFWRGWAQWVVGWTNSLLAEPPAAVGALMAAAVTSPALARSLANGFDDPREYYPWWFDVREAQRYVESMQREDASEVNTRELRAAFGQYATGVTVVTADLGGGKRVGMTANSFTSVSLDPPLILWCPGRNSASTEHFRLSTHFGINVLAREQHHLSRQFATPAEDKFAGVDVIEDPSGVPLIAGALAHFVCRTVSTHEAGDHLILVGEVEDFRVHGGEPLVFHSGRYHVATLHPEVH